MESIKTQEDLQNAILLLEQKQLMQKNELQQHYKELYEKAQPANVIKNVIAKISDAEALKKDILKAAIALAIGYLAKKVIQVYIVKNRGPLAEGIETIIQIIISGWLAKNGTIIKDIVMYFFKTILQRTQLQLSQETSI